MKNGLRCGIATPQTLDVSGFISTYKEAFGGPPYFESYTDREIHEGVISPHIKDGVVAYAADNETLIGFGCAVPFSHSPDDVQEFLSNLSRDGGLPESFDYRNAWYMSELGVRCSYRGMGIAWELVRLRMLEVITRGNKHPQYFMRTASVGSNSMPMYMKSGAIPLYQQQDVSSTEQATENHTQSLQRIYLWGDCTVSARKIKEIRHQKNYPSIDSSQ